MPCCFLNGQFVPLHEAQISVLDRGFIFGEGVYEVIPIFGRRPFRLIEHLARFARSMREIGMENPHSTTEWQQLVCALVERHAEADVSVYLQVTRGALPRNHAAPIAYTPTVFGMVTPLDTSKAAISVDVITLEDFRWRRCDIKATALLANTMARSAAARAGAYEAVLFREGMLTEGAASNVFVVVEGKLVTPPQSPAILPGVTRDALIEALADGASAVGEREISRHEFLQASEIWITSSTRDLIPVANVDGRMVGTGQYPLYARVYPRYLAFKSRELDLIPAIAHKP